MRRFAMVQMVVAATLAMGLASALAGFAAEQEARWSRSAWSRALPGGVLLVGEARRSRPRPAYPARIQPLVQAVFAVGAVVAQRSRPGAAGLARSTAGPWSWIFSVVQWSRCWRPASISRRGTAARPRRSPSARSHRPAALPRAVMFSFTYVLEGSRWNWFEAAAHHLADDRGWRRPRGPSRAAARAAAAACSTSLRFPVRRLHLRLRPSASSPGAALFGSASTSFLLAIAVLAFTPTAAGAPCCSFSTAGCSSRTLFLAASA